MFRLCGPVFSEAAMQSCYRSVKTAIDSLDTSGPGCARESYIHRSRQPSLALLCSPLSYRTHIYHLECYTVVFELLIYKLFL